MSRPYPDLPPEALAVVPLDTLQAATAILAELPFRLVAPVAHGLEQLHTLDEFQPDAEV